MQQFENSEDFLSELRRNPLLVGKIAVYNNPEDVSANLISLGTIAAPADAETLLDVIASMVDEWEAKTVFAVLDVDYIAGGATEQYDEAIKLQMSDVHAEGGLTGTSWGTIFPNLKEYKSAWDDFHGKETKAEKKITTTAKKKGCGCVNCSGNYMTDRDERAWYVFGFLLFLILIVVVAKYWK